MERQRKYKIFSIVALVLAICGMSLGFAAFSKVLTITASATVTPNEEDFKVVTYGFKDEESFYTFWPGAEIEQNWLSNNISIGVPVYLDTTTGTVATITNDKNNTRISDINVTFNKNQSGFQYYFIIKNEGKYDAYINLKEFENYDLKTGDCIAIEETANQDAINEACKDTEIMIAVYTSDNNDIEGTEEEPYYKLEVNDFIILDLQISTGKNSVNIDPYNVEFEDITINFSSAPQQ